MNDAKNEADSGASSSDAVLDAIRLKLWMTLREAYGHDLQSVFMVVTTQDKDNVLRQDSLLVYPPAGAAANDLGNRRDAGPIGVASALTDGLAGKRTE